MPESALQTERTKPTQERDRLSIASVTVTHNSSQVLPQHIEALLRQKRRVQEIVVVDNASTDGTAALLRERYPQVTVLPMRENLGASGAFAVGLAYAALERRHDWVWAFDHDSVPNDDSLELLLAGAESLRDQNGQIGILAPLAIHGETGTAYAPLLWQDGYVKLPAEKLHEPVVFADLVINSGSLLRRGLVEEIGLPRADFFMDFFDYEYCLRARSHGYKIAVITGSRLVHEIGNSRKVWLPGGSGLWKDHSPCREYYISRNLTYAAWWLYPTPGGKWFAFRHLARHAGGVLLFSSSRLACLRRMAQGFWDGRRASLGTRFLPD